MVESKKATVYRCPYCTTPYESEAEAIECRDDCNERDKEDVYEETTYEIKCEMCSKSKKSYGDAEDCERRHARKQDWFFTRWQTKKAREQLDVASKHPGQQKLGAT